MRATAGWILLLNTLLSCGSEPPSTEVGQRELPKNLLLISIDSLRADHVGTYGYVPPFQPERRITPHLDQVATRGLRFDSCWSSTSWTLPAHVSLFTGLDDVAHGVIDDDFRIDPQHQTLAEHLTAAGYRCRGIFSGPFLEARFGMNRGFESWRSARISETELVAEVEAWEGRRIAAGAPAPTASEVKALRRQAANWDVTGHRINEQALRDLEELHASAHPWMLFLHYYDPHYDYLPGKADPALARAFDPNYTGLYDGVRWYFNPAVRDFTPPFRQRIPERDLQHVESLYDGEIHFVDRQIGSLLTRLEKLGIRDDTVIAIVSDHGDEFFDHGGIGHRSHLHSELTRAVFLLEGARTIAAGRAVTTPVSFVDLAPTLIAAAGAPPWTQPHGSSRLPESAAPSAGAFSHLFTNVPPHGPRNFEAWRDQRFTVIRAFAAPDPETESLDLTQARWPDGTPAYYVYDREGDPGELRPIRPDNPAYRLAVEAMRADFLARQIRRQALPRSPLSQRLADRAVAAEIAMLEELGYVDGRGMDALARPLERLPEPELD
ncbi:MAG: sulfatase [Planctomycetes bacterium]|nr:sulfatase [Planctomycetota bacterium]